jgi:hypothetical protein
MQYNKFVTIWKGAATFTKTTAALITGLGAVIAGFQLPVDWETFKKVWPTIAIPLILAICKMVENVRKNANGDGTPIWKWPWNLASILVILSLGLTSCVSTRFIDSLTKPDGSISKTEYSAMSSAWPMGKIDTASHKMACKFGNATIGVGQDAAGIDNTAQVEMVKAMSSIVSALAPLLSTLTIKPQVNVTPNLDLNDLSGILGTQKLKK